jgi:Poly(3-hydroxyalkanoate) synthetase
VSGEDITFSGVMERLSTMEADVGQSIFDVVDESGPFKLLHYHPLVEKRYKDPLLIVYAFINRPYVLDLSPEISVIRKYLEAGFDVYMVDWGYPTLVDRYLDLDDYVDYIDRSVEYIKWMNKVKKLNMHGYCLGGTLSVIYTVLHQENVKI